MEFEEIGRQVEEYLAIDLTSHCHDDVFALVPKGWGNLTEELYLLAIRMTNDWSKYSIKLEMGLLRIRADGTTPSYTKLWEMVSQQTARQTALLCMICGKKAFRRKQEPGMPCLCRAHYVEYFNYISEK